MYYVPSQMKRKMAVYSLRYKKSFNRINITYDYETFHRRCLRSSHKVDIHVYINGTLNNEILTTKTTLRISHMAYYGSPRMLPSFPDETKNGRLLTEIQRVTRKVVLLCLC